MLEGEFNCVIYCGVDQKGLDLQDECDEKKSERKIYQRRHTSEFGSEPQRSDTSSRTRTSRPVALSALGILSFCRPDGDHPEMAAVS